MYNEVPKNKKIFKILIVDDEPEMGDAVAAVLELEGYKVATATTAIEALEKIRAEEFQLILMDIKLPDINGVEAFIKVKKISPKSVVIMMTAYSVEELINKAIQEGAYACIYKPFDIQELISLIKKALRSNKTILIVDDEVGIREGLAQLLHDKYFNIHTITTITAKDGTEALKIIKQSNVNLILLNVKLPDINGIEVLKRAKELVPNLVIIMMTGYEIENLLKEATSCGAYTCIRKPLNIPQLYNLIDQTLFS